ncbi:RNA pol II accessory factor, Cdc73 family-domain-containing protein [Dichotomocladium elegans]|nr:RNA pol II accessory factor, Cdc73 family-domain-containing protein [Dichotomocladium elegans]
MEPLRLLRDYTCNNKPVILKNAHDEVVQSVADATTVCFNDNVFPRHTPTQFRKSDDGAANSDTYTLDTLIFLVQNAHLDNSAYFKECRQRDIEHVSIVDRKKVLDYLTGKVDTQPNIVGETKNKRAAEGTRNEQADDGEMTRDDQENAHAAKRLKLDNTSHVVIDKLRERERVIPSQQLVLQGGKDFLAIVKAIKANGTKSSSGHAGSQRHAKSSKSSSKDRIPIIIVPAAPTSKFTLFNIKQFLENAEYVDQQELRSQGMKKPERVSVERRRRDGQVTVYHVIDNAAQLKQNDWDRVCCVFASGQPWQFKGWKYEKPIDLFSHTKGFYAKWQDEAIKGPAAEWNVTPVNIHRHQRHVDRLTAANFWDALDKYMSSHNVFSNA